MPNLTLADAEKLIENYAAQVKAEEIAIPTSTDIAILIHDSAQDLLTYEGTYEVNPYNFIDEFPPVW